MKPMELIRQNLRIDKVLFDGKNSYEDHVLRLDKAGLEDLLSSPAFSKVELDIAEPGTACRIMNVGDVVQPTVRLNDPDGTFPGLTGKMDVCGNGTSLMLTNIAVTEVLEKPVSLGCFIDMFGPAVGESVLCSINHVTIDAFPAEGVTVADYQVAIHKASKILAKELASICIGAEPDSTEIFSLCKDVSPDLPKVAYLCDVFCHAPLTDMTLYGESMQSAMPVILHPNEILDGAITDRDYGQLINADPTYFWQNHPIILDLYKRNGVDLNFVGVVVNNTPHTVEWKERNAAMAAAMVKFQLGADCCIVTKEGGGHPQVDVSMALDHLEKDYGIKAVAALAEFLSPNNGSYEQVLFNTPSADAMVSTGCVVPMEFDPAEKVIGSCTISPYPGFTKGQVTPKEGFIHRNRSVRGSMSQLGWTAHGSRKF